LYRRTLYLVRRPPFLNSTDRHVERVESRREEPSGIWALIELSNNVMQCYN